MKQMKKQLAKISILAIGTCFLLPLGACGGEVDTDEIRDTTAAGTMSGNSEGSTAKSSAPGPAVKGAQTDPDNGSDTETDPWPCEGSNSTTVSVINCPKGKIDGCLLGKTKVHRCIADPRPSCNLLMVLECPEGQIDACDVGGDVHECISKSFGSCNDLLALECPEGQIDACVIGTSDKHECVDKGNF